MFTGQFLSRVRSKAIRRGVWFRALDTLERGILTLASHVVDRVESVVLGVEIVKILKKLNDAMKSEFTKWMEQYGFIKVKKLAAQAMEWGNRDAIQWISEVSYIEYVTMLESYKPSGWYH